MSTRGQRIVADLQREDVTDLLTEIDAYELPPVLEQLVEDYQELEYSRPPFMWKWVHKLAPKNTLPCVDDEHVDLVPTDKTIAILFVTLIDDILEKGGDRATFRRLAQIPSDAEEDDAEGGDSDYVAFTRRVWDTLLDRIQRGPHYDTYEGIFRYDVEQAINAVEYSDFVIRNPELATVDDLVRYESHNMVMFAYADLDLMHTTGGISDDYATLREAIWEAQLMARIGNWLSTWERELAEGDYSSGVVVYALENDVIDPADLDALEAGEVTADALAERIRAADVEAEFFDRWDHHYRLLEQRNDDLETMDLTPFVEGMEEVLRYHMASTGLK
ncbi:terpene synthase family protein [Halorientalis halophila]|uniref:terpene synthase family protein n=1 Tax=Halorientalis halophila TaxID=3108499 RepID=UPI00300AF69D